MKTMRYVLGGMIALVFASLAAAQATLSSRQINVDIKPQPMVEALNSWAQQTDMQLIVPEEEATNRLVAPAVKGKLTAQGALDMLLAGSHLKYIVINERTVAIRESSTIAALPKFGLGELRNRESDILVASLAEVVVTGSRLRLRPEDIRADGSLNTPAPVTIFNREKIDQSGASSVSELLKYLPQQTSTRFENAFKGGAQVAELRGLGFDTTLVLIDGRRALPSSNGIANNAFDLNTLPLTAVERVELLSDSASAVYGADAIGGVINIIMKKDISRPVLDLHYGAAEGADERRASLSSGYSGERFRAALVLDYFDRGMLMGAERDRWNDQDYRRFGGSDWRSASSNPGNITSLTSENLPGLPSRFAAVPAGSTGVGLTPADFLETAGQRNLESLTRYDTLVPEVNRRSAWAFAGADLGEHVNIFGDFLYVDRRSSAYSPVTLSAARVPATNPYNPFGTDVSVDYLFTDPEQTLYGAKLHRGVAGLRGGLGSWDWEVSILRAEEDGLSREVNDLDTSKVNAALAETDPALALNVFQDGPGGTPALLASLRSNDDHRYSSSGTQVALALRGEMFALPAGRVQMVAGGEWLDAELLYDDALFVEHGRIASAAFMELRVPLVSAAMNVPAARELSLSVAARHDRYSDVGDAFNPQFGLVWRPVADLMLRASFGTSFRAPSLFELYVPRTAFPGVLIPDSLRGGAVTSITFISGGNPDLKPTEADSLTTGFVFTPSALQGLQLSGSYWRLEADPRVNVLPYDVLLANEERFPERVIRDEPTAQDIAAGQPGVLRQLDISRINFGSVATSGVDLAAKYAFETGVGRFAPELSAMWVDKYQTVDLPGTAPVDRVDIVNLHGTIARWRAVGTIAWESHGLSVSASARYVAPYDDAALSTAVPNGRSVTTPTLVDIQAALELDKRFGEKLAWLSGLKLTAGVSNLFDEEPGFTEAGGEYGIDTSQVDLRQRFVYARFSASF